MKIESFPIGSQVRLADMSVDPYPILRRLRELEPVSWIDEVGMWFVTRRDDVLAVLKDSETFTTDSPDSLIRDTLGPQMLSSDGAAQRRFRGQCNPLNRDGYVRETFWGPIEAEVNRLIDGFQNQRSVDLRGQFASPLSVYAVARLLGLGTEDHRLIRDLYDDLAAALANFAGDQRVRQRGREAARRFRAYATPTLERLEQQPDGSLLGILAAAPAADRLTREEILSNAMLIVFGGLETTESMILNAIWSLLTHRDQFEQARGEGELLARAIEESLRWEAAVQSCTRHATRAVELRGVEIAAGDTVQCMLGAANRDPDYFENPDEFDIRRRRAADHLTFGYGKHFCLGAPLARLEAQIGLRVLFQRLPRIGLDRARSTPPTGYEFRKPPRLVVHW